MKIYTFNDKVLTRNTKWLKEYEEPTPPTPSLPSYTIRMKFTDGVTPTFSKGTATQISSSPNVWDLTYENNDWTQLLYDQSNLIEVIGANTTGVTTINQMFAGCTALTTVALFDTSEVTNMRDTFNSCIDLTAIPLFNTSKVTELFGTFSYCYNVQTGALALYQQISAQATPITSHYHTFYQCGSNTVTGAAELAQIPSDWGGTAS